VKTSCRHRHPASTYLLAVLATTAYGLSLGVLPAYAAPADAGKGLTIAMHYVVPPFVDGSKVRTPEAIDTALAKQLADKLHTTFQAIPFANTNANTDAPQSHGPADVALTTLTGNQVVPASSQAIATGYTSRPMAIMRSDTNIKSWSQLKGRIVCMAEGGRYVGTMAQQYGAIEKIFRAPADSLLALRTGGCDAAVHDDVMLEELLKLPEWKKYSATLTTPITAKAPLVFMVPTGSTQVAAAVKDLTRGWHTKNYLAALNKKRVRDIAFEVYLDQAVPDCH
jgi:polar amino acid transport system substrate-binding protein